MIAEVMEFRVEESIPVFRTTATELFVGTPVAPELGSVETTVTALLAGDEDCCDVLPALPPHAAVTRMDKVVAASSTRWHERKPWGRIRNTPVRRTLSLTCEREMLLFQPELLLSTQDARGDTLFTVS